jgi:hypothetical protein
VSRLQTKTCNSLWHTAAAPHRFLRPCSNLRELLYAQGENGWGVLDDRRGTGRAATTDVGAGVHGGVGGESLSPASILQQIAPHGTAQLSHY